MHIEFDPPLIAETLKNLRFVHRIMVPEAEEESRAEELLPKNSRLTGFSFLKLFALLRQCCMQKNNESLTILCTALFVIKKR